MFDFTDRVVLVIGAAGNLGQATARAFTGTGASLVLTDHRKGRLSALFPNLQQNNKHLFFDLVNVTDPDSVQKFVDQTSTQFSHIDVLVNTVGSYRGGQPVHNMPLETWDLMMDMNARSALLLSRAVIPVMREQGHGKLIHIASRAAVRGMAKAAAYSAAKSALVRLVESMALELRKEHINVNCVLPGTIDTPENRLAMPKANFDRWVPPEAIADVILFLASETAWPINGAAIPVYGLS